MFKFICPRFVFKIEKWKWNKEYRLYVSNMGHFKDEHKQPKPIKMGSNGYIDTIDNNEIEDMVDSAYQEEIEGWITYNAFEVKPGEKETDSGYTDYPNAGR